METQSLENCICILKKLRDAHSSQLDTSVLGEMNQVISELEMVRENRKSMVELGQLSSRALQIIAIIVSLVSNLKDWMK